MRLLYCALVSTYCLVLPPRRSFHSYVQYYIYNYVLFMYIVQYCI